MQMESMSEGDIANVMRHNKTNCLLVFMDGKKAVTAEDVRAWEHFPSDAEKAPYIALGEFQGALN